MCFAPNVKIPEPPAPPPPPDAPAEMRKPKKLMRMKTAAEGITGAALRIPRASERSLKYSGDEGSGLRT